MDHAMQLFIPARAEDALVARMALCGIGTLTGLDVDVLGDLRTVTNECMDCLCHQPSAPARILVEAGVENGRFLLAFEAAERGGAPSCDPLDEEITRGVLETLMPDVRLMTDAGGVYRIECSMPV